MTILAVLADDPFSASALRELGSTGVLALIAVLLVRWWIKEKNVQDEKRNEKLDEQAMLLLEQNSLMKQQLAIHEKVREDLRVSTMGRDEAVRAIIADHERHQLCLDGITASVKQELVHLSTIVGGMASLASGLASIAKIVERLEAKMDGAAKADTRGA